MGLLLSLAFVQLIQAQLFGIETSDPLTLGLVLMVILAAALAACSIPAHRAAGFDPAIALRNE